MLPITYFLILIGSIPLGGNPIQFSFYGFPMPPHRLVVRGAERVLEFRWIDGRLHRLTDEGPVLPEVNGVKGLDVAPSAERLHRKLYAPRILETVYPAPLGQFG